MTPDGGARMATLTFPKGKTAILVCGDESRNKAQTMPGGSYVTREIQLPRNVQLRAADTASDGLFGYEAHYCGRSA